MARQLRIFSGLLLRLNKLATSVSDVLNHLVAPPPVPLSPVLSRRQHLAAAVDEARRIKRGLRR
jgi:hypothetical protein